MRRHSLLLLTILALCVTAPIKAQLVNPVTPAPEPQATPDSVVARLMTFDRNHDGLVARAELPERMLGLLTRGDVSKDGALDATEVRRLAVAPAPPVVARGLQPGQYGFGEDTGFDTRLHIDGAIEDLRLASATRDQALAIGRTFADKANEQAKTDLLATMEGLLTPEQLVQVRAVLDRRVRTVQFNEHSGDVLVRPADVNELHNLVATRIIAGPDLTRVVQTFNLTPEEKKAALVAVEQFKSRKTLSDADRTALLHELRALLDDQQRDDLRAALERRPIVKQSTAFFAGLKVLPAPVAIPQTAQPQPGTSFAIRDLVLRQ